MTSPLEAQPKASENVKTAFEAVYNWNYDPEIEQLRTLYTNALEAQWISYRELDWEQEIDRDAFSRTFSLGGIPIQETLFWKHLDPDIRWEISRKSAAFMLSNFLHGEQGALMCAAQLVDAVPHMDGKFYASTQTMDEARHVEVFAAYINKLDEVQPIAPGLKQLLDAILTADNWMMKAVGMNIIVEGLALYSFRDMRNTTAEPLLKDLLTYVSRDEARHTGFGIKYMSAIVPTLSDRERADLEDFGFEAARLLLDSRTGTSLRDSVLALWTEAGLDLETVFAELAKERDLLKDSVQRSGGARGPLHSFVLPSMQAIGLLSERIAGSFQEMFEHSSSGGVGYRGTVIKNIADMPDDLEQWVMSEEA